MTSARWNTKSPPAVQRGFSSGSIDKYYDLEKRSSVSVIARAHKSRSEGKDISKQRGKQPGKLRNAGKLSKSPDMPIDIMYDIFSFVHPMDLLRMSWTTKALRNVLTNKSSRLVWIAAFDNIPEAQRPPPCPDDLTEIAYANLLYNPFCMSCGVPRGPAHWAARVRACTGCIKNWVTVVFGVQDHVVIALSRGKLYSSSEILPTVSVRIGNSPRQNYVFTKDLKRLIADLQMSNDRAAVIQRYKNELSAKDKFARVLGIMDGMGQVGRGALQAVARDRRVEQILERLADEGWDEEILSHRKDYVRSIIGVEAAYTPTAPLTEKEWERLEVRILDAVRKCKKEIEDKALEARCISRVDKMREVIRGYRRTSGPHDFCPSVEDVWRFSDTRKLIINGTDEEFNTNADIGGFPNLISQILEVRTTKLLALLPSGERRDNVLSLAAIWFKCLSCHSFADGIDALGHQCTTPRDLSNGGPAGLTFDIRTLRQDKWPETFRFSFSAAASSVARGLILDCGEDPRSITLEEMNSKFHRFSFYEYGRLVVRNWKETFDSELRDTSVRHRRFLGQDECPEFVHDPDAYDEEFLWSCLPCWRCREDRDGTHQTGCWAPLPEVEQHIADKHGIGTPAEGVDYFYHDRHRPPRFVRVNHPGRLPRSWGRLRKAELFGPRLPSSKPPPSPPGR